MIQIDDAGWGSLVGGAIIGACRVESPKTQHAFREIPVPYFQGEAYRLKLYLAYAIGLADELMTELEVTKTEEVQVCTGYVLTGVRAALAEAGYRIAITKIEDPLQTLIEQELLERVTALGIETDLETITTKQGLYFWQCVKWLKGGDLNGKALPDREQFCKTGWGAFRIWADHPYNKAKVLAKAHKAARARTRRPW